MESCYVDFLQMKKLTTVCCAVTILSLYFIICYSFVLYLFWHGCKDSFGVCCQYLVDEGGWTPSTLGLPVTRHHFLSVFLYFCILCHIFVGSECLHLQAPRPSQSGYQHVFRLYFNVFNLYYCCDWFFYHKHRTTRRFLFSVVSLFKIVYWLYLYGRDEFVFVFHLNCIYMAVVNLYLYFIWIVFIWPGWMASCVGLPVTPVATFQSHYTLDILQYQSLGKILRTFPF